MRANRSSDHGAAKTAAANAPAIPASSAMR